MNKDMKLRVIPKEKAVFWMDEHGRWHNVHGPIEHPKIINYFHAAIQKDKNGYFLYQEYDNIQEKVYFPYQETAIFVFDVILKDDIILVLNTRRTIPLTPENLLVEKDQLYMTLGEEKVKFTEKALLKLSTCLEQKEDGYYFNYRAHSFKICD